MPGRKIVLANGEIYHVFNKGVASQPVFLNKKNYGRAFNTFIYYQSKKVPMKYSHFIIQPKDKRLEIFSQLRKEKKFLVEIVAFCFMPNHFHFLLKQIEDNGISKFISNFTNSHTRYVNTKNDRKGPLFQGKFKAVRIITDEQLLHVNRYIHLNPYTSYIVKNIDDLKNYPYSSFPEYLGATKRPYFQKESILHHFKNYHEYKQFVFDQANYQRELETIKHLLLED